jgi:hypothetical protein
MDTGPAARDLHSKNSSRRLVAHGPTDDKPTLMRGPTLPSNLHTRKCWLVGNRSACLRRTGDCVGVGGLLDFVRDDDNGITCPPRNPEALAAAMQLLLDDPARRARLAARARLSVEMTYDERVVFGRFAALARSLSGATA